MKYEAVFGDQSLFDGGPEDAECVAIDGTRDRLIFYKDIAVGDYYSFFDRNSSHWRINDGHPYYSINSMRRIIKEPKRWTVEDKKAGRLPKVGCKAVQIQGFCEVDVLMIHNGCVVVCNSGISDSRPAVFKIDSFMELFTPLETPEEKAERLRKEWYQSALRLINDEMTDACDAAVIYDALLSGALPVPTKGGE